MYFVAYGRVDASINYQNVWSPEIQTFSVPLGDFSLSAALQNSESLHLNLWLFIPTPKGWTPEKELHPRVLIEPITERLGDQRGIRLHSSTCAWDSLDDNVDFERRSVAGLAFWKVKRLIVPAVDSPQAILRIFRHRIEHCRGIQSQDYPSGIEVGSIR